MEGARGPSLGGMEGCRDRMWGDVGVQGPARQWRSWYSLGMDVPRRQQTPRTFRKDHWA